jgi:hypothetical protein
MNRRSFLNSSTLASAGMLILPSGIMAGTSSPNNKLNIALIGVWGGDKRTMIPSPTIMSWRSVM